MMRWDVILAKKKEKEKSINYQFTFSNTFFRNY